MYSSFTEEKKVSPEYRERFAPGDKCGVSNLFPYFNIYYIYN